MKLQGLVHFKNDWSYKQFPADDIDKLCNVFASFITEKNEIIEQFNFALLKSFSDSKGFMIWDKNLNPSKYFDALEWGRNMWEGDNLAFSSDEDFQNNIDHLKKEGIGRSNIINVHYYEWYNRYCWQNTGGSHHGAALIKQLVDQNRIFTYPAKLTSFSINTSLLASIFSDFHVFIAHNRCKEVNSHYYLTSFLYSKNIKFTDHSWLTDSNNLKIFVITKNQNQETDAVLNNWLKYQMRIGGAICFYDFLNSPKKYLGH